MRARVLRRGLARVIFSVFVMSCFRHVEASRVDAFAESTSHIPQLRALLLWRQESGVQPHAWRCVCFFSSRLERSLRAYHFNYYSDPWMLCIVWVLKHSRWMGHFCLQAQSGCDVADGHLAAIFYCSWFALKSSLSESRGSISHMASGNAHLSGWLGSERTWCFHAEHGTSVLVVRVWSHSRIRSGLVKSCVDLYLERTLFSR